MRRWRPAIGLLGVLLVAGALFFTGITWGLPSRASDRFLFGSRTPWTGEQILALAGGWDESAGRGADIAMHPLAGRDQAIVVNATDAQRAAIVRRFRLYSCQPDEMITFRALSRMHPGRGDLDPQFFQYGGLWVYPVGLLLKVASLLHLISLRGDLSFYLDHPEAFGRFYVVARCYSAAWGLVGVVVVWQLAKTWTGRTAAAAVAALLFCTMPAVVNAAHEAKPHLAGSVLTLLTVLLGMRYVTGGRTRTALLAGAAAGAAFAMVLTGIYAFAVLPVMVLLRPTPWPHRLRILLLAGGFGAIVFCTTNPYLPFDYLFRRQVVQSNVGNYGNFYRPQLSWEAVRRAGTLIGAGMSPLLAAAAVLAVLVLIGRKRLFGLGWLLFAPALFVAAQFVLLATAKPAEYARFALVLDEALAIAVAATLPSRPLGAAAVASLVLLATTIEALRYDLNFLDDLNWSSRRAAATRIDADAADGRVLALTAEPAPYCTPPADLFRWRWVLLPGDGSIPEALGPRVLRVSAADQWPPADLPGNQFPVYDERLLTSPISWANKPFLVQRYRWPSTGP